MSLLLLNETSQSCVRIRFQLALSIFSMCRTNRIRSHPKGDLNDLNVNSAWIYLMFRHAYSVRCGPRAKEICVCFAIAFAWHYPTTISAQGSAFHTTCAPHQRERALRYPHKYQRHPVVSTFIGTSLDLLEIDPRTLTRPQPQPP